MAFVDYEKKDNIVIITLNRPDRLNALGQELLADLEDACKKFEDDDKARVAILTGTGRAFSAGADVKEPAQPQSEGGAEPKRISTPEIMRKITKPVVVAVNGFALGWALFGLVMNCDIRIAAASATFGMPEVGLASPGGPERFIAQGIPHCVAVEIVLIGDRITAQRAYEIGLVNKVVPDEELMPAAMKVAERLTEFSPRAVRLIKQAGVEAVELSEKGLNVGQRRLGESDELLAEDRREAVRAFAEKRKPVWK